MIKMFAGLMRLECQGNFNDNGRARHHHCAQAIMEGVSASPGGAGRKRLHRRPGYMRTELPRPQSSSAGEEGTATCLISGAPDGRRNLIPELADTAKVVLVNRRRSDKPDSGRGQQSPSSSPPPPPQEGCRGGRCPPGSQRDLRFTPKPCPADSTPSSSASSGDTFSSSFSFIRQSLNPGRERCPLLEPPPIDRSSPKTLPCGPGFVLSAPSAPASASACHSASKTSGGGISGQPAAVPVQSDPGPAPTGQSELSLGERLWQDRHWEGREGEGAGGRASVTSDLRESLPDSDSGSLDAEAASCLSVDSDAGSASSVTSGYDSATPACEQSRGCWDRLEKTYQGVLQECLQNNRTNTKIESMMLKLQRLQQKAILDDDYDAAERFGKKLDELRAERASLRLGLPSTHPRVAGFLQRLTGAVHSALRRAADDCRDRPGVHRGGEGPDSAQPRLQRRERLVQEKHQVEEEVRGLQVRLEELQERQRSLEQQLLQEEEEPGAGPEEGAESAALRSCSPAQLRDLSHTLEDLVACQSRTQMCVSPPPSLLRLQEQNQALSQSIREATAKVVLSQRLGTSLRRKVSETETQLLALHEAKLAAIAGNDFSSAKELKAELRAACAERDGLEALAARLQRLNAGHSQELDTTKQHQQQLRLELEQGEARRERSLKENAAKYIELLEDRLHSCPALEWVWEADLEACHLFLRGLQLRTPSLGGPPDAEDPPAPVVRSHGQPCTKEEEDCAMLTALGGRWGPEASLQNSEFTKKLEEFLFCMEEHHLEEGSSEASDLTEHCELISDRLMTLEDDLQTAILNRDQALTQALEKEVGQVKAALQTMLAQLKEEEEEEERREEDKDDDEIEEEEGEEDEDQYFSDSWEI